MRTNRARIIDSVTAAGREIPFDQAMADANHRWTSIGRDDVKAELFDGSARANAAAYQRNIESYVGTVKIPVGIAGPLRVHGHDGVADYRIPLATTEAALVASFNRGSRLLTVAGGCEARVVDMAVSRSPVFAFDRMADAITFAEFVETCGEDLDAVVARVTSHGRLLGIRTIIEGNHVFVDLRFHTGDASGQNMVTFASDAICEVILAEAPTRPRYWFLEGNLSGDKKASAQTLGSVRGKRVIADAEIPGELIREQLHTTPERMVDYWRASAMGSVMSGAPGIQGQYANGLAALYLACGQDIACVAESASGMTRLEVTAGGDLYASVTLPSIMVGTVGGGTALPSARACLNILGLTGAGASTALAEVSAAVVLAGELSIAGAFCSGDFAKAHRALSRGERLRRETKV